MGKASISIAITSNFNPRGVDSAIAKMERLAVQAVSLNGKYGKSLVDAGGDLGKFSARLENMGKRVAAFGDSLTKGITIPMGIASAASIAAAVKIDTAWYGVRKTVNMTEREYEKLRQGAIDLSNTQPVTADQILNIEMLGGQLGISNSKLESFAKTVSGLDIATNLNSEEAAMQLAKFKSIVQMGEDDLDNFGSALVRLGNTLPTTESDIMNLALRFASAGHVVGMTDQEILGISATLSSLGMKADAGGSALSQVINKIDLAVDTNGEHLADWASIAGESIEEFKQHWKDNPADAFIEVLKGVSNAGDEMNKVLDDAGITQIRTSDAMRRLASSGDLMKRTIEETNRAWSENTALTKEVENRNESLASKFQVVWNRITNTAAEFGAPIADAILKILDTTEPLVMNLQELGNGFANSSSKSQDFAVKLGLVAMAAGPVLSIAGRIMQVAGKFGQGIARISQQVGLYKEALNTSDIAMLNNLKGNEALAVRLGVTHNAFIKAEGGVEAFTKKFNAASEVIGSAASNQVRLQAAYDAYAKALGVSTSQTSSYERAVISSAGASKYASDVVSRYKKALSDGAKSATEAAQSALRNTNSLNTYRNAVMSSSSSTTEAAQAANKLRKNTSEANHAAINAAKGALGYKTALDGESKSGTKAAQAALKAANSKKVNTKATKAYNSAVGSMTKEQYKAAAGTKEFSKALETQEESVEKAGTGVSKLKSILAGLAGIVITSAAVSGIVWIQNELEHAKTKAEEFREATAGLTSATERFGRVSLESSDSTSALSASSDEYYARAESLRQKQVELAGAILDTSSNASAQSSSLTRAWKTIEAYANKSNLSASDQYKLKKAVDEVNEACGTQYSVVDAASGKIADQNGVIQENTNAIKENIEARKKQLQLEAVESSLSSLYQQREDTLREQGQLWADHGKELKNDIALEKENARILTEMNKLRDASGKIIKGNERRYGELANQLANNGSKMSEFMDVDREFNQLLDSQNTSIENLEKRYEQLGGAISGLGSDIQQFLETSGIGAFAESVGVDLEKFSAACEDMGISVEDLGALSEDTMRIIVSAFKDGTQSTHDIVEALKLTEEGRFLIEKLGIAVQGVGDSFASSKKFITSFGDDIERFSEVCRNAGVNFDSLNSLTEEQLKTMASNFDGTMESIVSSLMEFGRTDILNSISQNWLNSFGNLTKNLIYQAESAKNLTVAQLKALAVDMGVTGEQAIQAFMAALVAGYDPSVAAELAEKFDQNFGDSINPDIAAQAAQKFVEALKSGMNPEEALNVAEDFIYGLQGSIASADMSPAAANAAENLITSLNVALRSGSLVVSDTGTIIGESTADGVARGIEQGMPDVWQSTKTMVEGTKPSLNSLAPYANESGTKAADQFGLGISQGGANVGSNADLLMLAAVAALMGGVSKAGAAGSDTSNSYASSIGSMQSVAQASALATLQAVIGSYRLGIELAKVAGQLTGEAYAESIGTGAQNAGGAASAIASSIGPAFAAAIPTARSYGVDTGVAYSDGISSTTINAISAANFSVLGTIAGFATGISPAGTAGNLTGTSYASQLASSSSSAPFLARLVATTTGSQFDLSVKPAKDAGLQTGSNYVAGIGQYWWTAVEKASGLAKAAADALDDGNSYAYSAGLHLGENFASGVSAGAASAISAARSIADQVAAILKHSTPKEGPLKDDDVWGRHMVENIAIGMNRGIPALKNQALRVADTIATTSIPAPNSDAIRKYSVLGTSSIRTRRTESRMSSNVQQAPAPRSEEDYDVLFRVFKQAVKAAITESGGISPTIQLDGRIVSRQLAPSMDYELGRLDRSRG